MIFRYLTEVIFVNKVLKFKFIHNMKTNISGFLVVIVKRNVSENWVYYIQGNLRL